MLNSSTSSDLRALADIVASNFSSTSTTPHFCAVAPGASLGVAYLPASAPGGTRPIVVDGHIYVGYLTALASATAVIYPVYRHGEFFSSQSQVPEVTSDVRVFLGVVNESPYTLQFVGYRVYAPETQRQIGELPPLE